MKKKLYNTSFAAMKLGVPAKWLEEQAVAGNIPCLRIKNRLLFNIDAVELRLLEMAAETPKPNGGEDAN